MVLREDQAKATYTQKVDFAKLRSELLSADSTESSTTRASHERLTNDLAKLNSRLRDEISRTQASVRLDLNLEKGRIREEANTQELKIKETETKIEQEVAVLREKLEAVKFQTLQWLMGVCTGKHGSSPYSPVILNLPRHGCFDSWCLEIADVKTTVDTIEGKFQLAGMHLKNMDIYHTQLSSDQRQIFLLLFYPIIYLKFCFPHLLNEVPSCHGQNGEEAINSFAALQIFGN